MNVWCLDLRCFVFSGLGDFVACCFWVLFTCGLFGFSVWVCDLVGCCVAIWVVSCVFVVVWCRFRGFVCLAFGVVSVFWLVIQDLVFWLIRLTLVLTWCLGTLWWIWLFLGLAPL